MAHNCSKNGKNKAITNKRPSISLPAHFPMKHFHRRHHRHHHRQLQNSIWISQKTAENSGNLRKTSWKHNRKLIGSSTAAPQRHYRMDPGLRWPLSEGYGERGARRTVQHGSNKQPPTTYNLQFLPSFPEIRENRLINQSTKQSIIWFHLNHKHARITFNQYTSTNIE